MRYIPIVDEAEIESVLLAWQQQFPGVGVLAMLPEAQKEAVALLQKVSTRHQIPLVGAIFPALLRDGCFLTEGMWLLAFEQMPYYALHENLPVECAAALDAIESIASDVRAHIDDERDITLFMLFDAMLPNVASMLDGLYLQLANRVHYAGGNAGSETFQPMPCLFDSTRLVQNGVLLLLLKAHQGAILEHGYQAGQGDYSATSTEANRIAQIDWRPAFDVYRELVREEYGVEVTQDNFYQYAVHFPFGIVRANHHVVVRIPVILTDDGSLLCVGEVPPNSILTLLKAPVVESGMTLDRLVSGLELLNGEMSGQQMLLFYCAGRRMHLGEKVADGELLDLAHRLPSTQICGAVSLGEIGGSTAKGYPLFHNATLVALRW